MTSPSPRALSSTALVRARLAGMTGLAAACAALTSLYAVAVCTVRGQAWDHRIWWHLHELSPVGARRVAEALGVITPLSCAAALGAIVLLAVAQRRLVPAVVGVVCAAGTFVSAEVLKYTLERPDLGISHYGNSFPSGHTGAVAALAVAAVVALGGGLRAVWATLATLATALTGLGVVLAGWHRPSDPVASALVAVAWAVVGLLVVHEHRARIPLPGS